MLHHTSIDSVNWARLLNASDNLQLQKIYESADAQYVLYNPNLPNDFSLDIQIFIVDKKNINLSYLTITEN
jgi:hypothetical protein